MKSIITIFSLALLIIIAGCSSDIDCSQEDTTYTKYGLNEETGECEVVEELEEDVCGNGVAEEGETYCNCPEDVEEQHPENGCYGEVGEYLENTCSSQDVCVLEKNSKVTSQTKQVEFRNADITIKGEFAIDSPYITNDDLDNAVVSSLELFSIGGDDRNIKNIQIDSVEYFNRDDIKLGEANIRESFNGRGSTIEPESVKLKPISQREDDVSIIVNIPISYEVEYLDRDGSVSRTEQKTEDFRESIGRWEFINPEYIEE